MCPIYEYECNFCKTVTEIIHKPDRVPKKTRCKKPGCNRLARRIMSQGAIQCDSVNDVKWLPSACKTLQKHGEPPLQSRSQYNKYLKDNHLACKG